MKLNFRKVAMYTNVEVKTEDVTIDLGIHDSKERIKLLKSLQDQIIAELTSEDCDWWIESVADEVVRMGYELKEDE